MATFIATTASNNPALKDVDAARKILDRYVFDGEVQAEISQDGGQGAVVSLNLRVRLAWGLQDTGRRGQGRFRARRRC
jgi:hypothetical protein